QKTGVILVVFYFLQCTAGSTVHFTKPPKPAERPLQNYFHAVFGVAIIALPMYQICVGYNKEWPSYTALGVAWGINIMWMVCIVLSVLYDVGLAFLSKQYRQEADYRKGLMSNDSMLQSPPRDL
ncbi:hypothetical protein DFH07DRAFT_743761, partial [Mycena maculata]